ncbi:MAG: DUF2807 domain-containing protein [Muribaculaceae bacterium]|nr:DUF2807 domain-containing protein [Muribaculaceae bacterium]
MRFLIRLLSLTTLLTMIALSAAGADHTFRIKVGQFDKLAVNNNLRVVYHANADSTGYAVYKAPADMADVFLFSNEKGNLKVQTASADLDANDLPVVHHYSYYLISVANSADHTLIVNNNPSVPHFTAKMIGNGSIVVKSIKAGEIQASVLTGNGSIILSGECDKALYQMVGTGTIQADQLKAETVQCKIMGSGTIGCWATNILKMRGIGSTKVYYKGKPKIKKVGGGKLFPLTAANEELLNEAAEKEN